MPARGSRLWRLGAALALVATACSFVSGETTTTAATTTTTTTTIAFPERSTTSTTIVAGVDASVAAELQAELEGLIAETEAIRGLEFLEEPGIVILPAAAFAERVASEAAEDLDPEEVALDERLLRLVGMLDEGTDLRDMLIELVSEQATGFYDADTGELVIAGDEAELTPLRRSVLVHELVHALTDQHFDFDRRRRTLDVAERTDEAAAFEALIEGDATYFQFVFIQDLPGPERAELTREARSLGTSTLDAAPRWIREDLAFPYDDGLGFVERLVTGGGIAAVDRAYLDPPVSTEHVLHPVRYEVGETVREIPELALELEGYSVAATGSLGEWGLRLMLGVSLPPGLTTQTADGWGADLYGILDGGDDLAFALTYGADTEEDAAEVADALVTHAGTAMGAGEGREENGAVVFDAAGPWVIVHRIGDGLVFVAATDAVAGRALRAQLRVP